MIPIKRNNLKIRLSQRKSLYLLCQSRKCAHRWMFVYIYDMCTFNESEKIKVNELLYESRYTSQNNWVFDLRISYNFIRGKKKLFYWTICYKERMNTHYLGFICFFLRNILNVSVFEILRLSVDILYIYIYGYTYNLYCLSLYFYNFKW